MRPNPLIPTLTDIFISLLLLLQLIHDLGINFLGNTDARENSIAGFDAKFAGGQIYLNDSNSHMIAVNNAFNFTIFDALVGNCSHDRHDFMGGRHQLILAFAAYPFKSIPGYRVPTDCPHTADNQKSAAAGKYA